MSQTSHAETAGLQRLTRKGQATRDRIVEAAAGLMFRQGVAGTTTEQVQAAAGVSASQLFHYFTDKRALVRAVIAYQTEAVLTAQQPLLARLDSMGALRAWADLFVAIEEQLKYEGGCPLGSLGSELAETDAAARPGVERGFARWEEAIRDGLRAMYARGDLRRSADPDALALALLTALEGGLLMTKIRRDPAPLRTVLDVVLAHIESLTPRRGGASRGRAAAPPARGWEAPRRA
jgi:TetR/AcrR family transcriptional regulator, transcriptional repressor for nem operon